MAQKTPVPPRFTSRSRPAGRLDDGMRVLKRQMQKSNNLQTELQTIADHVTRELEMTKHDLEKTSKNLATANQALNTAKEALLRKEGIISELTDAYMSAADSIDLLKNLRTADTSTIMNLKSALKKEKARADYNSTAMAKLEQLKSQWSLINNILSEV
ncbi:hypothetical protein PTMSG1_03635 [Pyrenophora teres f. maculata]|nr:hypothetical protein PTMSG1_03635 [Pyrenophora teres f. maculata]